MNSLLQVSSDMMGLDQPPAPQVSMISKGEQRQFASEMSRTYYAYHWTMNMRMMRIIPVANEHRCQVIGCDIKAHGYSCFGTSVLEICPTCMYHDGDDLDEVASIQWASKNVLFARPYLRTSSVPEVEE